MQLTRPRRPNSASPRANPSAAFDFSSPFRPAFTHNPRINERTLEKWKQARAKPNPQAAALVLLVRKFPDTLDRLDRVAQR